MAARKRSARASKSSQSKRSETKVASDPEVARLDRLAKLMHEHGLFELEVGADGRSVRMSKGGWHAAPVASSHATGGANPLPGLPASPLAPDPGTRASTKPAVAGEPFLSPMVGTFYRASSPEAKPFVMEGDQVRPDGVLCIIEAMKVMNEIKAEYAGKIVQILVENGEAVEYGQPLFQILRT